ncbi:NAD-dependent dehydratase [Christiangramia fulva]|uniref:NAD-dependent dehydratase n=1 Tax=Christiangramia fulva TaxID=2126553 RepID=A0A2R3Z727_9FLAO|nr:NAD-dependent epimerase/dehydratase family protein [Christiangramia fulva]AVR46059.1 NAD-dependent dehydratase [Christiangramia fulva]
MQTILGSGGAIGTELAKALVNYTTNIRLVSRHPEKVNETDELFEADLEDPQATDKAIKNSEIVYLCVGLPYSLQTWKKSWPRIMSNVITSCIKHNCKLVFFDNMYMYDKDHLNGMTEETPVNPCSQKGKVRAEIEQMLKDKANDGLITAMIVRSADFYGPSIKGSSILTETVFKPLSEGKKANWMGSTKYRHSFTYTPDAGKATALLGNTPDAYNEIWHLPTAPNPFTGKEWIEKIARAMDKKPRYMVAPKFVIRVMGIFNPLMEEMLEMMYQYDRDYVFSSKKFEDRFHIKPTPYEQGIKEIVEKDYSIGAMV